MRRLLPTVVVAVALSACGPAASPEQAGANQEILDRVAEQLAAEDGVTGVRATYVDDAGNEAKASVRVDCRGCDLPAVLDSAVRAVWGSEVTPLLAISASVEDLERAESDDVALSVRTDEAELTRRYGERPVPSLPGDD
ncbi:MAG TPA: hypothetical protein VMF51_25335 [Nocardioides sp.]|uniref:hypothetical protein n=1 Tax=Nocardioides sp. TaxID=35761 RepID=UPI002CC01773|nr:hypothetical protein [Nocardioides sp.]HTW18474.1 hypothetical protein [Nocardioides sp.]